MDISAKHGVCAIAEYDYSAKESDEIDLIKGAIINNIKKQPGGWWLGTSNGKTGMFPDNFVRIIDNSDDKSPVVLRPKSESIHRKCKVVYSYNQNNEDELSLGVGDVIEVLGVVEEGWWRGKLNGKVGVFPSNFVIPVEPSPILGNRVAPTTVPSLYPSIPSTDLLKNENRSSLHSSSENLVSGGIHSGISNNSSTSIMGKINKSLLKDKDKDVPLLPPKPVREFCRVLFPYEPQNDDELELQIGDIILIQSKELPDKGWWRGELKGKIGVFPDNFVTILPSDVSPNKDPTIQDRPPSGNLSSSSKVFIKKSGSSSSTHSNRKESFGSRDSLNDILSETGLHPGNVAAQRKSLENKNFDLASNVPPPSIAGTAAPTPLIASGSMTDVNNIGSSALRKTSRNSMDSVNKNSDVRKSIESLDEKKTPPPVVGKKPIIPAKKSSSVTSVAGNILSGIKHKVKSVEQKLSSHDTADGISASKICNPAQHISDQNDKNISLERVSISKEGHIGPGGVEFDNVERSSMLGDMRASRVKAPKRRPPSAAINIIGSESNNNIPVYLNGSSSGSFTEQYELNTGGNKDDDSPTSINEPIPIGDGEQLVKPKPREWEKMKAPWMAELKASQEKKKVSPNIEPRSSSESDAKTSSTEMLDKVESIAKVAASRKSTEATFAPTTATKEIKKESTNHSNITTNNFMNTTITTGNPGIDVTRPSSLLSSQLLKTSVSQDIDDIKLRPNSLSIRNRSTSPSNRTSLNKATSLDVQNVTTKMNSAPSSSSTQQHNNINHQLTNSISSTATVISSSTVASSSNSLPVSHENVCSRVSELEQRVNKLESIVQSQNKIIENLVRTLREETDKVKGLKTELDKYAQCVTQV